jgi:tRNA pseudouridine32 synthase/23S rRNA pseudouridine746 synthase
LAALLTTSADSRQISEAHCCNYKYHWQLLSLSRSHVSHLFSRQWDLPSLALVNIHLLFFSHLQKQNFRDFYMKNPKPDIEAECKTIGETAINLLSNASTFSKSQIKDAMNKGAVWLKRGKQITRIRRATKNLLAGDILRLYYDAKILALKPVEPELIDDSGIYSLWYKPAGLLAQGSHYGDHCALERLVQQRLDRDCFLIHRLDREADGLMVFAHNFKVAAKLSAQWQEGQVSKFYRVGVNGLLPLDNQWHEITKPLDGKNALTRYRVIHCDDANDRCVLDIELITGRLHQIRRHMAGISHPVIGDSRYGKRFGEDLQLTAYKLAFNCPRSGKLRTWELNN